MVFSSQLDNLEQETVKWCREILSNSPTAIRVLKAAINASEGSADQQVSTAFWMSGEFIILSIYWSHCVGQTWLEISNLSCLKSIGHYRVTSVRYYFSWMSLNFLVVVDAQALAGNSTLLFYSSDEAEEGRKAYLEGRRPNFSNFKRLPWVVMPILLWECCPPDELSSDCKTQIQFCWDTFNFGIPYLMWS